MENNFYVYLYEDIDGTPVYVGKGSKSRAWDHKSSSGQATNPRLRKLLAARMTEGYSIEPRIIARGSEVDMFLIEVALIKHFGRQDIATGTLFNHTDGGEGVSNPSDEVRKKMSEASFRRYGEERCFTFMNQKTGEEFKGNCPQFAKFLDVNVGSINRLVLENTGNHSIKGWTVSGSGHKANEYETIYNFVHVIEQRVLMGTQSDLMKEEGLSASLISQMVNGIILHANGWCIEGKEQLVGTLKKNSNGNYYTPRKPWQTPNATPKSLLTWAMADQIHKTFDRLQNDQQAVGAKAILRSMELTDMLSERVTDSIIRKIKNEEKFDPINDDSWLEFKKKFEESNTLPENRFDGKLIDGRSKGPKNKKSKKEVNAVLELISKGIGVVEISRKTGVSRSAISRWKKKYSAS